MARLALIVEVDAKATYIMTSPSLKCGQYVLPCRRSFNVVKKLVGVASSNKTRQAQWCRWLVKKSGKRRPVISDDGQTRIDQRHRLCCDHCRVSCGAHFHQRLQVYVGQCNDVPLAHLPFEALREVGKFGGSAQKKQYRRRCSVHFLPEQVQFSPALKRNQLQLHAGSNALKLSL